jgi:hypothetical protein
MYLDIQTLPLWNNCAGETVGEFPRKTLEACKNVVTLGKIRHARTHEGANREMDQWPVHVWISPNLTPTQTFRKGKRDLLCAL